MALAVDASVTIAWLIDGEATPYTEGILSRLEDEDAFVPPIWRYEIANALLVSERRGRITHAHVMGALERVADLRIIVDEDQLNRLWSETIIIARTFQLSVYDAAYVDLAAHRGLALATIDANMRRAANRFGVTLATAE